MQLPSTTRDRSSAIRDPSRPGDFPYTLFYGATEPQPIWALFLEIRFTDATSINDSGSSSETRIPTPTTRNRPRIRLRKRRDDRPQFLVAGKFRLGSQHGERHRQCRRDLRLGIYRSGPRICALSVRLTNPNADTNSTSTSNSDTHSDSDTDAHTDTYAHTHPNTDPDHHPTTQSEPAGHRGSCNDHAPDGTAETRDARSIGCLEGHCQQPQPRRWDTRRRCHVLEWRDHARYGDPSARQGDPQDREFAPRPRHDPRVLRGEPGLRCQFAHPHRERAATSIKKQGSRVSEGRSVQARTRTGTGTADLANRVVEERRTGECPCQSIGLDPGDARVGWRPNPAGAKTAVGSWQRPAVSSRLAHFGRPLCSTYHVIVERLIQGLCIGVSPLQTLYGTRQWLGFIDFLQDFYRELGPKWAKWGKYGIHG